MHWIQTGFNTICCPLTFTIVGAIAGILFLVAFTWFLFTAFAVLIVNINGWLDAVEEINDLRIDK